MGDFEKDVKAEAKDFLSGFLVVEHAAVADIVQAVKHLAILAGVEAPEAAPPTAITTVQTTPSGLSGADPATAPAEAPVETPASDEVEVSAADYAKYQAWLDSQKADTDTPPVSTSQDSPIVTPVTNPEPIS